MSSNGNNEYTKTIYLSAIAIFIATFLLKFCFYTQAPFTLDESFTFYHSKLGFSEIINTLQQGNNPPLYELFMHIWIEVFGDSIWVLRLPSLFFVSLIPAFWYLIIRRIESNRSAFFIAVFLSFMQVSWLFSQEMRAYALAMFLISLAVFVLSYNFKYSLEVVISACLFSLAVYTHYLSVLCLPLVFWYLVRTKGQLTFLWRSLQLCLLLTLFLIPAAITFISRVLDPQNTLWGVGPDWTQLYGQVNIAYNYRFWLILGVFLIGFLLKDIRMSFNFLKLLPEKWRTEAFYLAIMICIYFVLFLLSFIKPIFISKYLSFVFFAITPMALLLICHVYTKTYKGMYVLSIVLIVLVSGLDWVSNKEYNPQLVVDSMNEFKKENSEAKIYVYPSWYKYSIAFHENVRNVNPVEIEAIYTIKNIYFIEDYQEIIMPLDSNKALLFVDAGEEFLTGNQPIRSKLEREKSLYKVEKIDNQVEMVYYR